MTGSREMAVVIACQPRGLDSATARRWRVEALLDAGFGSEDIEAISRTWPGGVPPVTAAEVRAVRAQIAHWRTAAGGE